MPFVSRLAMASVKGTALYHPEKLVFTSNGVLDNRRFYLVDEQGRLFNGKQHGRLVRLKAEFDGQRPHLTLHFPDGAAVEGRPTELSDAIRTNFYGRSVDGHLVEGPWSAALTDFVGESVSLVAVDRPGDAVDVHPITLVSSATIEYLRTETPDGESLSHRRFRMLVDVGGCEVHEEDTWAGRHVRVGGALLSVVGPVPRCVVTNQDPDSGDVNFNTLKAIVRYRGELAADLTTPVDHLPDNGKVIFGMYATVEEPGDVSLDDRVKLVESAS